jgi:hypothetical protein
MLTVFFATFCIFSLYIAGKCTTVKLMIRKCLLTVAEKSVGREETVSPCQEGPELRPGGLESLNR